MINRILSPFSKNKKADLNIVATEKKKEQAEQ